ncbi:MAG: leucyl/phenylalanyl-tRNA--protein transferase [Gammaproteobacteria bacterium]|nr:leucyl/phenylalanyl-tRNA--protein transferase [Gammaproteobacteria bacterium]
MVSIPLLAAQPVAFPDPTNALDEPDGLLAAGGELSTDWLLKAYAEGIFPWYGEADEHILWWSPKYRAVLTPGDMRVTKSLSKRIRNSGFKITVDCAFKQVINHCATARGDATGTWITAEMIQAYVELHRLGFAHSVEVWSHERLPNTLVGGLYGVSLGRMFFGESMFSLQPDASKIAFYHLQKQLIDWEFDQLDCQILNPHLASLGVKEIPRAQFLQLLRTQVLSNTRQGIWLFT